MSHKSFEPPTVTPEQVERYRVEARAMQSRETARLARRLVGASIRLLRRAGTPTPDATRGRRTERHA